MSAPDRICVCGDTEAEHAPRADDPSDVSCAYCDCTTFQLDAHATRELAAMYALLSDLPEMGVIIARDDDS